MHQCRQMSGTKHRTAVACSGVSIFWQRLDTSAQVSSYQLHRLLNLQIPQDIRPDWCQQKQLILFPAPVCPCVAADTRSHRHEEDVKT